MIRHVALFTFNDAATPDRVRALETGLLQLRERIDGIKRFTCGSDLGMTEGAADYAVVADFASMADYRAYADHPDHLDVIQRLVEPIVAGKTRIQFSVSGPSGEAS